MAGISSRNFGAPDDTRKFDKGQMDIINIGGMTVGRAVFEPGWKWSECVKPVAGTDLCEVAHTGYVVSGQLHVVMRDGTTADAVEGDMFVIEPGHDAWTVGNVACIALDFQGAPTYAK